MERDGEKIGALYVYSRQSGRLINFHKDARTMLSLSAGGTEFCSGLRIILDDSEGHLPLNPTKQEVAFSEMQNGELFRDNLWRSVGAAAHSYYKFHIKKFDDRKKELSKAICDFGEQMATESRLDGELANLNLTSFKLGPFKASKQHLRVEVEEEVGGDTLYRLQSRSRGLKSKRGSTKKITTDAGGDTGTQSSLRRQPIRKKKMPQPSSEDSDSGLDVVEEKTSQESGVKRKSPEPNSSDDELFSSAEEEEMSDEHVRDDELAVVTFLPHVPSPHKTLTAPCSKLSTGRQLSKDSPEVVGPPLKVAKSTAAFDGLFGDEDDAEEDSLKEKLAQKDELLKALTIKLEERNRTVSELCRTVQDKENEIADLKEQLHMICRSETISETFL